MLICLDKHLEGPLGIHVLPYCDDDEQCEGLIIKEIVKGGRIDRDGRFAVGDRIIEVNDQTLLNVNFETAQSLIGNALKDNQLRLNIVKNSRKKQMNYTLPNDHSNHQPTHHQNNHNQITNKLSNNIPEQHLLNRQHLSEKLIDNNDANLVKETKDKVNDDKFNELNKNRLNQQFTAQQVQQNNFFNESSPDDYTPDSTFKRNGIFNASNTRRIGKKYHIRLVKDINGLGFSITTRDNQVGQCPIYIKTILPVGAAKKDGSLKGGDRLLEVNGIDMNGKTHEEALKVLREIETGQTVDLIVSRQENNGNFDRTASNQSSFNKQADLEEDLNDVSTNSKLPRQIPVDKIDSNQLDLAKTREVLSFNIPLNDTGSAGLGVSVKGKTSTSSTTKKTTDLGIFVKNIITGGAAFKDGRLKPNDQLISINGISLLNSDNAGAMNTLRCVLKDNGGVSVSSNSINLVVARVTDPAENPNNSLLSTNSMAFIIKDELYDTFSGITRPADNMYHQRNVSTISTDSMKLNFYEQNYQPSPDQTDFMNQPPTKLTNDDFNELYNLNRKSNIYNGLASKDSLSTTDSNDQFTISTPLQKTSMKSDFTENDNLNELSINKFMNNSNRTDVLIENDDQENADPNAYRVNDYFNQQQAQSNVEPLDDSLNKSKDSQMMNLSNVTNQLSLNDDEETGFNFQRDGFGRQSMSEKRYAQLDAKNTDTYKRAKQRKLKQQQQLESAASPIKTTDTKSGLSDQTTIVKSFENTNEQRQSKRMSSRFPAAACCCFNEPQTYSQSSRSSCPYHSSSQQTSPKTDQTISSNNQSSDDFYSFGSTGLKSVPIDQSSLHYNLLHQQPTPFTLAAHHQQHANQLGKLNHLNSHHLNQQAFLSNNRQTPMNHMNYHLNHPQANYGMMTTLNGYDGKANCVSPQFGQWLGMKKSSSLESLQTMMYEIKKENINTNQPYNTMRRPNKVSRNRNTNESFRTAIDKSYEEYMDNLTMETVNEEFSESGFSITPSSANHHHQQQQQHQQSALTTKQLANENHNNNPTSTTNQSKPSSTSLGTTLSNGANEISDDEIGLIRRRSTGSSKKKAVGSGILRTLFRFGSKKFKDKAQKLSTPQHIKKELEEEVEKIRARKAALYEQEIIQEYYKRLIDQQKFQQIVSQQVQQRQQNLSTPTSCGGGGGGALNGTLKKQQATTQQQSLQQQVYKKQEQTMNKNLYVMQQDNQQANHQAIQPPYLNLQSNYGHQQPSNQLLQQTPTSTLLSNRKSNQVIMTNSKSTAFDTSNAYPLQTGYALQNRPSVVGLESATIERPKSSYLGGGFDQNNILVNGYQNGGSNYFGGANYFNQDLSRKPFTNSHLNTKQQHPTYRKDKSIQPFETVHSRTHNYDLKDAMQRPGSRVAIDLNEDLNQYVITVARKNSSMNQCSNEVRPYV